MAFFKKNLLTSLSVLALAACTSLPENKIISSFEKIEGNYINTSDFETTDSSVKWWKNIDNHRLNKDIEALFNQNLALKEAGERVIQSDELRVQNRSFLFPSLTANASGSRAFQNTTAQGISGNFGSTRFYNTNYNPALQATWEIDLFGRIQNGRNAAEYNFIASQYDREALAQSLIAQLVNTYVDIATYKTLLEISKEIAHNRSQTYELIKRRYDLGLESVKLANVYLAEENLQTAQSDIHQYETLLTNSLYSYDILLGQKPQTTNQDSFDLNLNQTLTPVSECLPAALIDNRPDLKAARSRIDAAGSNINVAIADLYPSLNLSGALGFSGNETRNLFTAEQLAGSILGSITTTIFQGGRIRSNIRLKESEARELSYSYAGQILQAISDVENALKAKQSTDKQIIDIEKSIYSLKRAEELTYNRYIQGIESLQSVLDIQQSLLIAQQRKALSQQEKWGAHTSLILALGGNWLDENTKTCQAQNNLSNNKGNNNEK